MATVCVPSLAHSRCNSASVPSSSLPGRSRAGSALDRAGIPVQPAQRPQATTVRQTDTAATLNSATVALGAQRRALPAGPPSVDSTPVGARLQAAYAHPRPGGQPWTARTLAEAAGCGRSSAASFLQRHRPLVEERSG
jgi:hypothetical protein